MSTLRDETPIELRRTLRKMRRLALAFHGSELRLLDRAERRATVLHTEPGRPRRPGRRGREKVAAQA